MQIWSWSCPLTFRSFFPANDQQQEVTGVRKSYLKQKKKRKNLTNDFSIKMEGVWGRWVVIILGSGLSCVIAELLLGNSDRRAPAGGAGTFRGLWAPFPALGTAGSFCVCQRSKAPARHRKILKDLLPSPALAFYLSTFAFVS